MVNINWQTHILGVLSKIIWDGNLVFDYKIIGISSVLYDGCGHDKIGEVVLHPFLARPESTFVLSGIYKYEYGRNHCHVHGDLKPVLFCRE